MSVTTVQQRFIHSQLVHQDKHKWAPVLLPNMILPMQKKRPHQDNINTSQISSRENNIGNYIQYRQYKQCCIIGGSHQVFLELQGVYLILPFFG